MISDAALLDTGDGDLAKIGVPQDTTPLAGAELIAVFFGALHAS